MDNRDEQIPNILKVSILIYFNIEQKSMWQIKGKTGPTYLGPTQKKMHQGEIISPSLHQFLKLDDQAWNKPQVMLIAIATIAIAIAIGKAGKTTSFNS